MAYKFNDTPARKPYEEPGEYKVSIDSFEHKFSSRGDPMILLKLRTDGGALVFDNIGVLPETADEIEAEAYREKWGWKVDPMLACFFDLKKGDDVELASVDWCRANLTGKSGQVILAKETGTTGKVRNNVEAYLRAKPGSAARIQKAGSAPATTSAPTTKSTTATAAPEPEDDEIPF
jgi:hypothetical protein